MGEKSARIRELGMKGWELRWRVCQSGWWRKRVKEERRVLGLVGLDAEEDALAMGFMGRDGSVVSEEVLGEQVRAFDDWADREELVIEEGDGGVLKEEFMVEWSPPSSRSAISV